MNKKFKLMLSFIFAVCMISNINAQSIKDWNGFGGNKTNDKISYAKTPTGTDDVSLVKAVNSSGYVMDPIIVGDKMYAVNGSMLTEYDKEGNETGRKVSTGSVGFFSKIATGDGKIFVAASNNIIAFDIETFEPIWQTEKVAGAQALSAITYHNGYIYSGYTIPKGATTNPSDGFFFALAVKDDDPAKTDEIKDYAWTYPVEEADQVGSGYYWADAAVANNTVVFAGDNGVVVAHHLTKDIVYDKYQLSSSSDIKKVRATIVYDKEDNAIFVGTQDTHELYKIPFVGRTFDRSEIKMTDKVNQISGGFAIGSENLYIPSGGMYGKGFTVLDKDLNLVGVESSYGTQSIPLVSEFSNGVTYLYFLDYNSGKLIIGKDANNGSMPVFSEYKDDSMQTYNSSSVVPFYDGTLVIPFNGFSNGGFVFVKSADNEVTKADIETLINKTDTLTKFSDYEQILDIKTRVADFKEANPTVTIDNEAKLDSNYATMEADMKAKADSINMHINQTEFVKIDAAAALGGNLSDTEQERIKGYYTRHLNFSEQVWNKFSMSTSPAQGVLNISADLSNKVTDGKTALKYKGYIMHLKNNYNIPKMDEDRKAQIEANLSKMIALLAGEENAEAFEQLDSKIAEIPSADKITLNDKSSVAAITTILDSLSEEAKEVYKEANAEIYQKYEEVVAELEKQQAFIDKLNDDIAKINPQKVTIKDEVLVNDIIKRYNTLGAENKKHVSDWYENVLDAKKAIDKITSKSEKKGDVTYTYKKISGKWYVIRTDKNNSKTRIINYYTYDKKKCKSGSTSAYNCMRRNKYYKETKSGKVIKRKQTITYNVNVQISKNLIQDRNSKGKYVSTYLNTRYYHKNKKLRLTKVYKRSVKTNKYTSIRATYYYSNGKRQRVLTNYYSKGKIGKQTDYRYNKKGQLRSNKYGKAYYIRKNYKNGKSVKTYKYKYNSKGKKVRI